MPLTIELRERSGRILGACGESWDSVAGMWPDVRFEDYPLLAGVDRDDNTIFNRSQMGRVVRELERLIDESPPRRREFLAKVLELCRRGTDTVDSQLWFVGD
jgi:hypothetical protein